MLRYALLVFIGACSYGILSTFVKFAYADGFTTGDTVGSQLLLGIIMMAAVSFIMGRKKTAASPAPAKLKSKQAVQLLLVGTCMGLTGIFYYGSLQTLPASIAIVLLFQFTWIGVLLDALLERKKPERQKLLALIPIVIGTFLAGGLTGGGFADWQPTGLLFGLLSAVSYSLFIVFSGRIAVETAPLKRSTWMLCGSAVLTLILFPPTFLFNGALWHGLLLWGFLLAFFGAVIPTLCYTIGVPFIGGALATILSAAELPVAVISSGLVLGETVSAVQWAGVAIILLGVALPELLGLRKNTAPAPDVEGSAAP